jgi:hypothetical protein
MNKEIVETMTINIYILIRVEACPLILNGGTNLQGTKKYNNS